MPEENEKLAARMVQLSISQAELARQVNAETEVLTGKLGKVTDADVRRWLRGRTKWPQDRIRLPLERVLSTSSEDLGFVPRKKKADPVRRRTFLNAASGSAMALGTSGISDQGRLGIGDVRRFHGDYVAVLRADDAGRGSTKVEDLAVELASRIQSALALSTVSTRVRDMLHRLAAEAICLAAFASLDASAPQRARAHLDRALAFAGLSRDSETMYHVWNHMFLASSQSENHAEAVAGAEVMKRSSIARRDPLYASLGHLRNANGLARVRGRRSDALRALNDAERAFSRTADQQRPEWVRFYDGSEADALSSFVWSALGDHARAEYCLHRTLAAIPDNMIRNRALYTAHLSLAQARQGDLELASTTSRRAHTMLPSSGSQRTIKTLTATYKVLAASGSQAPEVVEWIEESAEWI